MEREDNWSRSDFFRAFSRSVAVSEDAITDPRDAARLEKSRQQAKRGELFWGAEDEDEDESNKSVAGD